MSGLRHLSACASAEMADALASGASVRKDVGVQVPPRARSDLVLVHITALEH